MLPNISNPPSLCEYAKGPCDQSFDALRRSEGLFLYPSEPTIIASTIEETARQLGTEGSAPWLTWKHLGVPGQIIFCEICKALRGTQRVVADVTTLNFNLLFEIGFAVGLGIPVLPIRDTSFAKDAKVFHELGLIDTLGYLDFQNSTELAKGISKRGIPGQVLADLPAIDRESPLYVVKSPIQSEGMVRLMSAVNKSGLKFRAFDPLESPRLSLHEAVRQTAFSLGILLHLVSPERVGAVPHNGRCAFVAGLGIATGKRVLMLQETRVVQPIDYREVVRSYDNATAIPEMLIPFIKSVVEMLQAGTSRLSPPHERLTLLEKIDLGDLAAENEILALRSYFVQTGQYNDVKRGHARLVVGRKGAGKTAIFYGIREEYIRDRARLVLDLKPEGHQFMKLREAILEELSPGVQQHVITAFWNYLLLMEIAHKIVATEQQAAYRDLKLKQHFEAVRAAYELHRSTDVEQGDFSERLLALVDDIVGRRKSMSEVRSTGEVTQLIYRTDIRQLNDAIGNYINASRKEEVWLLFDNLDKGWPILEIKKEDVGSISALLDATRKLQRQFENRSVELRAVVFLRNDIYEHLVLDPADRGKENPAILDWNDAELLKELLRKRIAASTALDESFEELWRLFFCSHVKGEESFSYILSRTLMRPREVLRFIRGCINVAVNRGHEQVTEDDIVHAEQSYSDDALVDLSLELRDVRPQFADAPYAFIGQTAHMAPSEVTIAIANARIPLDQVEKVRELLLWFGFLGISVYGDEERFSYQYEHNIRKMKTGVSQFTYCIHPTFRRALGCTTG